MAKRYKSTTKKKQHFVPRFYLKNFSNKKKGKQLKHLIWCFNKSDERSFIKNINDVAHENYFYDVIRGGNFIENKLERFENEHKKVLKTLITEKDLSLLSKDEKKVISHLIVTQFVRTREMRDLIIGMDQLRYENNITTKYEGIGVKFQHLGFIYYILQEYVTDFKLSPFLNMKWSLMINNTVLDYWTSDNPVNIYNGLKNKYFANIGLIGEGVEIYYPLTPKLCLTLVDSKYYPKLPNESIIQIDDVRYIIDVNRLQVILSGKEVYSINNDFSIAHKILEEYPQFKQNNWNLIKDNYTFKKSY